MVKLSSFMLSKLMTSPHAIATSGLICMYFSSEMKRQAHI